MHYTLETFTKDDIFFILDFDGTITSWQSVSSLWLFRRSGVLGVEFEKRSLDLFEYFHPFEIDHTLTQTERGKLMFEWHSQSFLALKEFELTFEKYEKILWFHNLIQLRGGIREFLQELYVLQIPVIIFSAGVESIIRRFLQENNLLYTNIDIVANSLFFDSDGKFTGISETWFIYPTEKTWDKIPEIVKNKISNRKYTVLCWDMMDDVTMAPTEDNNWLLKIGFLNTRSQESKAWYDAVFDIVVNNDSNDAWVFTTILEAIKANT